MAKLAASETATFNAHQVGVFFSRSQSIVDNETCVLVGHFMWILPIRF